MSSNVRFGERLASLSTSEGIFSILAVDHRDALRIVLDPEDPSRVEPAELTDFKRVLVEGVGTVASGVMLEPEYSIPQLVDALPAGVGFFAALEAQGYGGDPYSRTTNLLEGWSPEQARDAGASGAKLLIFYTPDAPEAAERQDAVVAGVIERCNTAGLPLLLEPLAYATSAEAERKEPGERRRLVVEMARRLSGLGAGILKLQFPADHEVDPVETWADACAELDSVVSEPWALLSLGVEYDTFRTQVEMAAKAGASGFMVGRAAWAELAGKNRSERVALAGSLVRDRLLELRAIAVDHGRPYTDVG